MSSLISYVEYFKDISPFLFFPLSPVVVLHKKVSNSIKTSHVEIKIDCITDGDTARKKQTRRIRCAELANKLFYKSVIDSGESIFKVRLVYTEDNVELA